MVVNTASSQWRRPSAQKHKKTLSRRKRRVDSYFSENGLIVSYDDDDGSFALTAALRCDDETHEGVEFSALVNSHDGIPVSAKRRR